MDDECSIVSLHIEEDAVPVFDPNTKILDQYSTNTHLLTITLKPKLFKFQSITQYEITVNEVKKILSNSSACLMSTELTIQGCIHYHAIVRFRNDYNRVFVINQLKKCRLLGFIHIKPDPINTLEKMHRSYNYLMKDIALTMKVLHNSNYKPEIVCYL